MRFYGGREFFGNLFVGIMAIMIMTALVPIVRVSLGHSISGRIVLLIAASGGLLFVGVFSLIVVYVRRAVLKRMGKP